MVVGATLSKKNPDKKIYIYPSVYDAEGTVTQIDLTSPEDYKKKLNVLKKMSRSKK